MLVRSPPPLLPLLLPLLPSPAIAERRLALIDTICASMRAHPKELTLQRTSAAMLSDLAHAGAEMKERIVAQGGRRLVEQAMALHSAENDPQAEAEWRLFARFIRID